MTSNPGAALALLLVWATPVWATPQGSPPGETSDPDTLEPVPLSRSPHPSGQLFLLKFVMEHQREIGLRPAQADAIKQAMIETQQQLLELQWKLDAEGEELTRLLAADHVDEKAALAKVEQLTAIELRGKTMNFALLVRIKNQLDPEQQAKLRTLSPARPSALPRRPPASGNDLAL